MNIGNLVTWKVDYVESISRSKIKNPDLEIGIVFEKSNQIDHDDVHDQPRLIGVFWFTGREDKCAWIPISNLSVLKENTNGE